MLIVYALVVLAFLAAAWLLASALRRRRMRRSVARATAEFVRNRLALQQDFCAAANVSGKPRGLIWKNCDFQTGLILARDRATGELIGLAPVTISFEAVPGGGMEEVEAVGNLRAATAILTWTGREWATAGRTVFNLEPREVIDRYRDSLEPVVSV